MVRLHNISMGRKITGLLLAVGLIPLALAVWYGGMRTGSALMDKATAQLQTVRQIKKAQVEGFFERRHHDVEALVDTVGTLRTEAFRKLTAVREDRKSSVVRYLKTIENQVATLAEQPMVVEAAKGFHDHVRSFRQENGIDDTELQRMRRELHTYYTGEFRAEHQNRNHGQDFPVEDWFARLDDDGVALQHHYIYANLHPLGAKHWLDRDDSDRSAYGKLHGQVHPVLRNFMEKFGYHDIFIADPQDGRIVYSAFKELDFASSLKDGAIADTRFAVAFRQASQVRRRGVVMAADFAPYWPSYGDAAGFVASPIFDGERQVGILMFQFPLDNLNAIMTERTGLGRSGETYLVGADRLMRSDSFLDPGHYTVTASFRDPERGRVDTEAVRSALAGETATRVILDYNGNPVLSAWTPLTAMGLQWALVAEVDVAEAFVPVDDQGNSYLARIMARYGYQDILLIQPDGHVFHSVARTPVQGTNLLSGPYAGSHLAELFRRVLATGRYGIADLAPYAPRDNEPAFFVAQPALHNNLPEVVVALEMPLAVIDGIINQRQGMGETGETFLVGRHQGRIAYRSNRTIEPARVGESDPEALAYGEKPLNGETGTLLGNRSDGEPELVDYAPLTIPGLNWAIISELGVSEVKSQVQALLAEFLLVGLGLALLIALIAWLTARGVVRPLLRLQEAATAIAGGNLTARSGMASLDEVGQVGAIFDHMAGRIEQQHWLNTSLTRAVGLMQRAEEPAALADDLLQALVPLLQGGHGVIHLFNPSSGRYELLGNFRHPEQEGIHTSCALGEGLVGRCALTGQTLRLDEIPAQALRIGYGVGAAQPVAVIAVPAIHQGKVLAVLEIASFQAFTAVQQTLMEELGQRLGLTLENLQQARETRELLEETRHQAEELQAQAEELETQQEELRQINEALQTSEAELETRQEALKRTNQELEQANQYKSEFLANMSHELRTPLNSLLILAKSLAGNEGGNLTGEQVHNARIIHESGRDLLHLINEILDLSKIEAGHMEIHGELLNVRALADHLLHRFRPVAENNGLVFLVEVADDAPATLYTDVDKVERIAGNLLSNACKFTRRGQVAVRLQSARGEADMPASSLAMVVTDTGIGIPANKRAVIFEAFRQADGGIGREFGGTGLGLSIASQLADLLGGKIHLASNEGVGSVFTLFLPTMADMPEVEPVTLPASTLVIPPIQPGDRSVLVIEDDATFASIVCNLARQQDIQCLCAADGEQGLALAKQFQPTGVILDLGLPGLDGWGVLERLKADADTRHIPVHIVSALDDGGAGLKKGAIGHVTKPVTHEQLDEIFQRIAQVAGRDIQRVLLVEDDPVSRILTVQLLAGRNIQVHETASGEEALGLLEREAFDCMILDLGLPDISGFELLERLAVTEGAIKPPVIVHSGQELSREDYDHLKRYTDSIVIKGERSPERLLDEVVLFLHRVVEKLPAAPRRAVRKVPDPVILFKEMTALVVDDDVRGAYAISRSLEAKGMQVIMAANGQKALEMLDSHPATHVVLMDIMMPVMDGFQTMRAIRDQSRFAKLPIIALTAKAMAGDREQCLAAGASDYLAKPLDMERLFAMLRIWLYP